MSLREDSWDWITLAHSTGLNRCLLVSILARLAFDTDDCRRHFATGRWYCMDGFLLLEYAQHCTGIG